MSTNYSLVAVKRAWVPEWLWRLLGPLPVYQPVRWLVTKPVEEAT